MKKAPLSPSQYVLFSMARLLLILNEWKLQKDQGIESERLMVFDFSVQYPREICLILPDLLPTLEAESLTENDLSDLFARRNFENIYERFNINISCLTSRGLITQALPTQEDPHLYLNISDIGAEAALKFSSALSFSVREITRVLIDSWSGRNPSLLISDIFKSLPDQAVELQSLTKPFEVWGHEQ